MPKGGNNPNVHQLMNGCIKCELPNTMEDLATKRNKVLTLQHRYPRKYWAKWKKSNTKAIDCLPPFICKMYGISKPIIPWTVWCTGGKESDTTEHLSLSHNSVGKESACNVGDLGSIPRSSRPPGEGMATHSSIRACRIPWAEEPGRLHVTHGVAQLDKTEQLSLL